MGASLQQRVDDGWTVVGLEILLIVEDSGMQRRGLSDEATTHVRVCSKLQQFANDNEVAASELSTSDRFNERGLACRVLTVDVCASCQLTPQRCQVSTCGGSDHSNLGLGGRIERLRAARY